MSTFSQILSNLSVEDVAPAVHTLAPSNREKSTDKSYFTRSLLNRFDYWELDVYASEDIKSDADIMFIRDEVNQATFGFYKPKTGAMVIRAYRYTSYAANRNKVLLTEAEGLAQLGLSFQAGVNPEKLMKYITTLTRPEGVWTHVSFRILEAEWLTDGEVIMDWDALEFARYSTRQMHNRVTKAETLQFRAIVPGKGMLKGLAHKQRGLRASTGYDMIVPVGAYKKGLESSKFYFGCQPFVRGKVARLSVQPIVMIPALAKHLSTWAKEERLAMAASIADNKVSTAMSKADSTWAVARAARIGVPIEGNADLIRKVYATVLEGEAAKLDKWGLPAPTAHMVAMSDQTAKKLGLVKKLLKAGEVAFHNDKVIVSAKSFLSEGGAGNLNHGGPDFDGDTLQCLPFIDENGNNRILAWRLPMGRAEFGVYAPVGGADEFLAKFTGMTIPTIDTARLPLSKAALKVADLAISKQDNKSDLLPSFVSLKDLMEDMARHEIVTRGLLGRGTYALISAVAANWSELTANRFINKPMLALSDLVDATVNLSGVGLQEIENHISVMWSYVESAPVLPRIVSKMCGEGFTMRNEHKFTGNHLLDRIYTIAENHLETTEKNCRTLQKEAIHRMPKLVRRIAARFAAEASDVWYTYVDARRDVTDLESDGLKELAVARQAAFDKANAIADAMSNGQEWHRMMVRYGIQLALIVRQHTAGKNKESGLPQDSLCWARGSDIIVEIDGEYIESHERGMLDITLEAMEYFGITTDNSKAIEVDASLGKVLESFPVTRYTRVNSPLSSMARSCGYEVKGEPNVPEMIALFVKGINLTDMKAKIVKSGKSICLLVKDQTGGWAQLGFVTNGVLGEYTIADYVWDGDTLSVVLA